MSTEIKNKITLASSFIDEAFDAQKVSDYQLTIQIGSDGILVAINEKHVPGHSTAARTTSNEPQKNKFIAFESYRFQYIYGFAAISDILDVLTVESKLIPHKYGTVACVIVNNLSTIIPSPLFENDKKGMYLKFNATLQIDDLVEIDELKNLDAKNIFALPSGLKKKLGDLYNKVTYHHFSSVLIEGLLFQNKNQIIKKLFVHVQPSHFEALVIEGKKLLFYNTFNHHTAEDFIYYLLFVCEQLQLNPENIEVVLLGEIEKNSEIYSITQKYIRNLKFAERTDDADFSYQLQTIPKHNHFTIFNNYLQ